MTVIELRQRLIQKLNRLNFQQLVFLEKLISTLETYFPPKILVNEKNNSQRYPLRGVSLEYIDPLEPVALEDWEILQ